MTNTRVKKMNVNEVKYDCHFFKGHLPCKPNKLHGVECSSCGYYEQISKRILIIKLGAIGDVIRTTPLIEKYQAEYKGAHITWLTLFPDVLPKLDRLDILPWEATSLLKLQNRNFDIAINLDKDEEACQLLSNVSAKEKYGFTWENQHISPATSAAEHKLLTGFFDHISIKNEKNYLEEIFEIAHFTFEKQEYQIRRNESLEEKWTQIIQSDSKGRKVIGLNTGCGPRWKTRLWNNANWEQLIEKLNQANYFVVLLGGPAEDEKNNIFQAHTEAKYYGHFSLEEFIAKCNAIDVVVTQVSLMMHVAVALKKTMILMNNIFNKHEFELYGRGEIIEPSSGCDCFYGNSCSREKACMDDIQVDRVFAAIIAHS